MKQKHARFQVVTALKIQVEVFWVVTPYSVVVGYQRFGETDVRFPKYVITQAAE